MASFTCHVFCVTKRIRLERLVRPAPAAALLTAHPVIVPVQMRTIPRITTANRGGSCSPGSGAVGESALLARSCGCRREVALLGSWASCRRGAVAVIVTGLAVGVASLAVQATGMAQRQPRHQAQRGYQAKAEFRTRHAPPVRPNAGIKPCREAASA